MRPATRFCAVLLAVSAALVIVSGCAKVSVRKVPTPSQYIEWTDSMQRQADRMEGIRYYLPRPFLNVIESFPVRTDIYLANGVMTPDNQGVILRDVRPETGLAEFFVSRTNDIIIPKTTIAPPSREAVDHAIRLQSAAAGNGASDGGSKSNTVVSSGVNPGTARPATAASDSSGTPSSGTGVNERNVSNDNSAYAYQPMRGNMDIAFLPDFEEQYAVSSRAGLGNAKFALNLGQGWSLQSLNSITDNRELNKRIFDVIDSSIELAKAAAKAAVGVPPVPDSLTDKVLAPKPERATALDNEPAGTPVTLKIVVIHYAAKGLYPVIKPRELQERLKSPSRTNHFFYLNLHELIGKRPDPVSSFDPNALAKARLTEVGEARNFTVPRYPYQYVSFMTFRYLSVQVARPGDKPFESLYHPTGTLPSATASEASGGSAPIGGGGTGNRITGTISEGERNAWMSSLRQVSRLEIPDVPANGAGDYAVDGAVYDLATRQLTVSLKHTRSPQAVGLEVLTNATRVAAGKAYQESVARARSSAPAAPPIETLILTLSDDLKRYLEAAATIEARVRQHLAAYSRTSGTGASLKAKLKSIVKESPLKISVEVEHEGNVEAILTPAEFIQDLSRHLVEKLGSVPSVEIDIANLDEARRANRLK